MSLEEVPRGGLTNQKSTVDCHSRGGIFPHDLLNAKGVTVIFFLALFLVTAAETARTGFCTTIFLFSCLCFTAFLQLTYYKQENIYLKIRK